MLEPGHTYNQAKVGEKKRGEGVQVSDPRSIVLGTEAASMKKKTRRKGPGSGRYTWTVCAFTVDPCGTLDGDPDAMVRWYRAASHYVRENCPEGADVWVRWDPMELPGLRYGMHPNDRGLVARNPTPSELDVAVQRLTDSAFEYAWEMCAA